MCSGNPAARVSALLALAAFGVVITAVFDRGLDTRLAQAKAPSAVLEAVDGQREKLAAIELPDRVPPSGRAAARRAIDESFVAGSRWVTAISAMLAAAGAGCAWLFVRGPAASAGAARRS